jgi:riboflavin biosynthesis pyrimidine reductase
MPSPGADDATATQLSLLGADGVVDDDRLAQLYSYPDALQRCWVRANAITSLDGGATTDGTSGGLGGPGDRRLFGVLREQADVIVVGAGTARAENYSGAQMGVAQRRSRQARGQSEVPPIAIVTRSGHLDHNMAVLTRTEVVPLVLTCTASVPDTRRRLAAAADVVDCSASDPAGVDQATVLMQLADRGLLRVLTEGGPTLLSSFIESDLLDELCLTIAPVVVGGQSPRIATGPGQLLTGLRRAHLLTDDAGYLYTRYVRAT